MNVFAFITAVAVIGLALAWNFVPSLREKMRGISTIAETVMGAAVYYLGFANDVFHQLQGAGYLPDNWKQWVPLVFAAYIIVKRWQTKTPVGQK